MDTCKKCLHYIPNNETAKTGSCTQMGDEIMIADNKTIIDTLEDDLQPLSIEVGENFGCIHWEFDFIPDLKEEIGN